MHFEGKPNKSSGYKDYKQIERQTIAFIYWEISYCNIKQGWHY